MFGGRNSGAGIAAVVEEEGSLGPVEGRLVEGVVGKTERFLVVRLVLRTVVVQIAADLVIC
jgi:hypothetical protein